MASTRSGDIFTENFPKVQSHHASSKCAHFKFFIISYYFAFLGPMSKEKRKLLADIELMDAKKMLDEGESKRQVAKRFEVAESTLRKRLKLVTDFICLFIQNE